MTRAAEVASEKDPNSSVPVPKISATLSPTLFAIMAGLET
jgi:hypothetical protein